MTADWHPMGERPPEDQLGLGRSVPVTLRWPDGTERRGWLSYWCGWTYIADGVQLCEDDDVQPNGWKL